MATYIEGKRAVSEALAAKVPLVRILLADNIKVDKQVENIQRKAEKARVPIKVVSRKKLDELSDRGSHQGIVAQAVPFEYAGIADIVKRANAYADNHEGRALIVLLDHVTDAGNLGAIVRSVDAVGGSGVIIPNKRAAGVTAATYKSSAGAITHVPVAQVPNLAAAIQRVKDEGFWVAGASEQKDGTIWDTNLKGKMALVFGNENEGLSRLTQRECDFFVALPMDGKVGSLNVAQAATACMYEWLRQNYNSI